MPTPKAFAQVKEFMPALPKPLEILDLVDEVARLIAEAKIAFPVTIHLP